MKTRPLIVLFVSMFILIGIMLIAYQQFQKDKPLMEEQNRQAQLQQQAVLTPDQIAKGVSNFINDTTSTIHTPPPLP